MKIVTTIVLLLAITDAQAYLDPGTGSMLLQVILGGVAAIGVALKLYWHKIMSIFGMAKEQDPEDESA